MFISRLKLYILYAFFLCSNIGLTYNEDNSEHFDLNSNNYDLFTGDWLDTWEDPQDQRFIDQKINLKKHFAKATAIREELYNIRKTFADRFREMEKQNNQDYLQLGKDITQATKDFVIKYLDMARPASISLQEMAFIGFGSMARGESGIVTDLEGSLVWDKNVIGKDSLGLVFGQALSNILDGLIGHPIYGIRGFRLDEADHSPFHRAPWARFMPLSESFCMALKSIPTGEFGKEINRFRKHHYFPFEGSWLYTNSTPLSLANFVNAGLIDSWPGMWSTNIKEKDFSSDWYQWAKPALSIRFIEKDYIAKLLQESSCSKNFAKEDLIDMAHKLSLRLQSNEIATISNFPQLSRNRVFIYGNIDLFKKFEEEREKILNANNSFLRRKLAMGYLEDVANNFSESKIGIVSGKAPDTVDLKRNNYRFEEQLYTNLAFLLDLKEQNQGDIIKRLINEGKLDKNFGEKSLARVNNIFRLRLKKQIALQSQLGSNMQFLTKEEHNKKLKSIEHDLRYYDKIVKTSKSDLIKVRAKTIIAELKSDLKLMPKLIPGNDNSIFTPKDIDYIRKILFPEQSQMMKKLKQFINDNRNIDNNKYNFNAFK